MAYDIPSYIVQPPTGGQRRDLPNFAIPEGSAAELQNFVRRSGLVQTRSGYTTLGASLGDRPTGVILFPHYSGNFKLVVATESGWYDWDGSSWTDRTESGNALTGGAGSFNLFRVFYKSNVSYLVGVNGYTDAPKKWDGTAADYSNVGGSPPNAKCIGVLANRMILANFTNKPVQVDVSAFNDFESGWGTTQLVNLYETPGEIVAIQEMGNLIATIYKTDAIYSCIAVAALSPFKFELKKAGIAGPLSPACVVPTPQGHHWVFARDFNVYLWDGANYAPVGEHVRHAIEPYINKDKAYLSWGFYNEMTNEAWFFFPPIGSESVTKAIVIKKDGTVWPQTLNGIAPTAGGQVAFLNTIVIGDLVNTIGTYTNPLASYTSYQNFQILGHNTGQMYLEQGNLDAGNSFEAIYRTGMYAPAEDRRYVTIGQVELFTKQTGAVQNVDVSLLYSEDGGFEYDTETAQTINIGQPGPFVLGERRTSRYFGVKMSADVVRTIQLESMRVSGVGRGRR